VDIGRFLIETHRRTGRAIKELARLHEVSVSWLFKRPKRYRLEGPAGLEPRARRPHRSPARIRGLYEDEIVALHKERAGDGLDAGAQTLHVHLAQRHAHPPSVSTILRVRKARGFVTLEPHKRPKSSFVRFEADLPNEMWQADMTHIELANGELFEVRNMVDDHSPAVCGVSGHEGGQGRRRGPGAAPGRCTLGLSCVIPQRQRSHLSTSL
jgi:hypothetical protein